MQGAEILDDLRARSLVHDHTDESELVTLLSAGGTTLYHGIDPTASSLHLGNLIGVLAMRRFQDAGHRPLALVGGATGLIGDPSGRSDERNLLDTETLDANLAGIRGQLQHLLDFDGPAAARMVNNHDWTRDLSLLDFLRDTGKHATVNQMVAKDSVKSRMSGENGISFTEFTYMLLQAHDFWWLHENYGCDLQIGGSDQWGNITAGIDLTRRRGGASVHGLTWPLMTRSDGAKFGKTADGAVWLDADRTLPYEFHQYFLRVDDRDVERTLLQLTLLSTERIAEIMAAHGDSPEDRLAQGELADSATALIHGAEEVRRSRLAAAVLFGSEDPTAEGLAALRGIVPETLLSPGSIGGDEAVVDLLVATEVCSSRGDARRTIAQGGIRINGVKVGQADAPVEAIGERFVLIQRGKKQRHLAVTRPD